MTTFATVSEKDRQAGFFRALRSRNFRLYFFGQGLSLIGTWMQQTAMSWLVYRITHSPFMLGLVSFSALIPNFFLSPLAGVLADRLDRRKIILVTQTLLMTQAAVLAGLALTGVIRVWHIIVLDVFFGMVTSVDIPTRQSFMLEMIERKEELANGIALNAVMVNSTRLMGPTIAGLVIATSGEGVCFLLNAVSFMAVLVGVALMRVPSKESRDASKNFFHDLREGLSYAFGFPPIGGILILISVVSLVGMPYSVLLPLFVSDILKEGPHTLGFLTASSGLGALAGSVFLVLRKNVLGMGRILAMSVGVFGLGLLVFSVSRHVGLDYIVLFACGWGVMVMMASANTLLQTLSEDDKRGRVLSLYVAALMGVSPIGSLLAGFLSAQIGAPQTVFLGGLCCCTASLVFFYRLPHFRYWVRPLYIKMGILPAEQPEMPPLPTLIKENKNG